MNEGDYKNNNEYKNSYIKTILRLTCWNSWKINGANIGNVFFANVTWTNVWLPQLDFLTEIFNDEDSLILSGITDQIFGPR